jgi:hypothetical protein
LIYTYPYLAIRLPHGGVGDDEGSDFLILYFRSQIMDAKSLATNTKVHSMRDRSFVWDTHIRPFFTANGKKSLHRIVQECREYRQFYRMRHRDYFELALYMEYIDHKIVHYIPRGIVYKHLIAMNGELHPELSENKPLASERLVDHQVRCPQEIVSFEPGRGFVDPAGKGCSLQQASEMIAKAGGLAFAKPVAGKGGTGARTISADLEGLQQIQSDNEGTIVQEIVAQHPALASLNPASVKTIRIHTLLVDHNVESHVAALRVGRQGQIVDNIAAGGLCVGIDMATGRLARFARTKPQFTTRRFDRHPDTGVAFDSITIPFWPEVLELVRRGAHAMSPLRSLGWDVAIAPDGPVVIEVNAAWDCAVFQLCQPLGATGLARHILAQRS